MNRYRDVLASLCLLIGACSPAATGNNATGEAPRRTAAAPMPATPPSAPAGCSDKIDVVLDEKSLIDTATQKPFPAPRLAAFDARIAASFHLAADSACRTQAVRRALAPIRKVIVQSGSGATESTFYRAEDQKPGELVFQWAFNEADLNVPERKDIESGLRCWADPTRKECADMGD